MSGGKRYPFPKHVWAPTGGWWPNPKNWKRNTYGVGASIFLGIIYLRFFGPQIMTPTFRPEVQDKLVLCFEDAAREGRIKAGTRSAASSDKPVDLAAEVSGVINGLKQE
ncbi:uncharacterized protein V2V93DRAFT_362852 [Kockiozyma suomiensis]|uniref:uncharacterized protein n=1 Tax=Kockiozyma suomiensis TaxID=1337062 RepID=UPI003343684D